MTIEDMCNILSNVATRLSSARSRWDGEEVDGEMAFFAATDEMSRALNEAIQDFVRSRDQLVK